MTRIVLVGGCGFVGQHLSIALNLLQHTVLIVDVAPLPEQLFRFPTIHYKMCNILDSNVMQTVVGNFKPEVVVHLASWGMSGSSMLSLKCHDINVNGTHELLKICIRNNIPNFVYTSTYNVVYGGEEIECGDEGCPYFPLAGHCDQYGPSKAIAEKMVLNFNGEHMSNGLPLRTASIRPAAIYGEGELRHIPRILKHIDGGLLFFRVGRAVVDWVHVENLCNAYILLIDKLMMADDINGARVVPAGQAYFVSDGTPIDNFEFFRLLIIARGRCFPALTLPTSLMLCVGWLCETWYVFCKLFGVHCEPLMTRAEVLKVGRTHYFSIGKARKELAYIPSITSSEGSKRLAAFYSNTVSNADFFQYAHWIFWILCDGGIALTAALALLPQEQLTANGFMHFWFKIGMAVFRSQHNILLVLYLAIATHVLEACISVKVAFDDGYTNTWGRWAIQTLFLGYPSLGLMYSRRKWVQEHKGKAISRKPK